MRTQNVEFYILLKNKNCHFVNLIFRKMLLVQFLLTIYYILLLFVLLYLL